MPFALATNVLKKCRNTKTTQNDKLVICVGGNDYDLKILSKQLRRLLSHFKENNVIILNV